MNNQKVQITSDRKANLKGIYTKLLAIHCNQNSVTEIELLFFEVLSICRNSIDEPDFFDLLAKLRLVQYKEYLNMQNKNLTVKNKVLAIKRFRNSFRLAIFSTLKKNNGRV